MISSNDYVSKRIKKLVSCRTCATIGLGKSTVHRHVVNLWGRSSPARTSITIATIIATNNLHVVKLKCHSSPAHTPIIGGDNNTDHWQVINLRSRTSPSWAIPLSKISKSIMSSSPVSAVFESSPRRQSMTSLKLVILFRSIVSLFYFSEQQIIVDLRKSRKLLPPYKSDRDASNTGGNLIQSELTSH